MIAQNLIAKWSASGPYLRSVLRIVTAFLFVQYGTTKLFAFPAAVMPDGGTAPLMSLAGVAGALEFVGGTFLLVGLFTRPVAFLLSGEMAVAYFIGHAAQGLWPVLNGGAPAVFFAFLWLYFSAAGAGPWSLDNMWQKRAEGRKFAPRRTAGSRTSVWAG
ncbi:MAG TPA: DoxX family protein [Rhodothermales bacterium]|nr:DoxX family protein [Rhodothermales bacterium]